MVEMLASLGEQNFEEIEAELAAAQNKKKTGTRRSQPRSASEIAAEISRNEPERSHSLQKLASRYDNKTFLPTLRDVRRFLDRTGVSDSKPKDRRRAALQVVTALSRVSAQELDQLAASPEHETESDYSVLAREIIGGKARSSGN